MVKVTQALWSLVTVYRRYILVHQKGNTYGTCLAVQWLRLSDSTVERGAGFHFWLRNQDPHMPHSAASTPKSGTKSERSSTKLFYPTLSEFCFKHRELQLISTAGSHGRSLVTTGSMAWTPSGDGNYFPICSHGLILNRFSHLVVNLFWGQRTGTPCMPSSCVQMGGAGSKEYPQAHPETTEVLPVTELRSAESQGGWHSIWHVVSSIVLWKFCG